MLSGVYCFAVFVWTREIGLVFLLSIFSARALTKQEAKHIEPAHGTLLASYTQWKGLTFPITPKGQATSYFLVRADRFVSYFVETTHNVDMPCTTISTAHLQI